MKAIILAAGQGTRMRPLSYVIPKILLPVRGKPVLDYLLSEIEKIDVTGIYIIASEHLDMIQTYIDKNELKRVNVLRGLGWETGGDLALGLESIKPIDDDLVIMNGDIVTDLSLSSMLADHIHNRASVTMGIFNISDQNEAKRFGQVIVDENGYITKFAEKEEIAISKRNFVNSGFYIFSKDILKETSKILVPRKFKLEKEFFPDIAQRGKLLGSICKLSYWWDVGTMESYLKAEEFFINGKEIIPPGINNE